jgi:hypothetical protein
MRQQFSCTVEANDLGKRQVLTGTDPVALEKQGKALGRTWQAEAALEQVQNILRVSLNKKHAINWDLEKLKHKNPYPKPKPSEYAGGEPQPTDARYKPQLLIFDRLIKSRAEQKIQAAHDLYIQEHCAWENARQQNLAAIEEWHAAAIKFQQKQENDIAIIDKQKSNYESLQPAETVAWTRSPLIQTQFTVAKS